MYKYPAITITIIETPATWYKELQSHVTYDNQSLRMKRQPKDYHLQTLCAFVEVNGLIIYAIVQLLF